MKSFFLITALVVVAGIIIWTFRLTGSKKVEPAVNAIPADSVHWTWENPYTFKQAHIPAAWKQTMNSGVQDTVLTLEHESGKSLIYILYEEPVNYMTLPEFIEIMRPLNQKEFGIEQFEPVSDEKFNNFYEAESARYLGNSMVGINVKIWSDGSNSFWETVQMTDLEYKTIEYDAKEVVQLLIETTL